MKIVDINGKGYNYHNDTFIITCIVYLHKKFKYVLLIIAYIFHAQNGPDNYRTLFPHPTTTLDVDEFRLIYL